MKNQAQLIAYVDRLPGGTFRDLSSLLEGPLERRVRRRSPAALLPSDRRRRRGLRSDRPHAGRSAARHLGRRQGAHGPNSSHGGSDRQSRIETLTAVSGLPPARRRLAVRRNVSDLLGGCSRTGRRRRTCRRSTPSAPRCPSRSTRPRAEHGGALDHFTSEQIDLDVDASGGAALHLRGARPLSGCRHHDDPARRRRACGEEGRHELLHDSGDVRFHCRADGGGASARHGGAGRGARPLPGSDRDRPPGGSRVRLRAATSHAARAVSA